MATKWELPTGNNRFIERAVCDKRNYYICNAMTRANEVIATVAEKEEFQEYDTEAKKFTAYKREKIPWKILGLYPTVADAKAAIETHIANRKKKAEADNAQGN